MRPCERRVGMLGNICGDPAYHWAWHRLCGDCAVAGHDICQGHALCNGHAALGRDR